MFNYEYLNLVLRFARMNCECWEDVVNDEEVTPDEGDSGLLAMSPEMQEARKRIFSYVKAIEEARTIAETALNLNVYRNIP